jgi:hypothetical protein
VEGVPSCAAPSHRFTPVAGSLLKEMNFDVFGMRSTAAAALSPLHFGRFCGERYTPPSDGAWSAYAALPKRRLAHAKKSDASLGEVAVGRNGAPAPLLAAPLLGATGADARLTPPAARCTAVRSKMISTLKR